MKSMGPYSKIAFRLKEDRFIKSFDTWACQKFSLSSTELEAWLIAQPIAQLIKLTESFGRELRGQS